MKVVLMLELEEVDYIQILQAASLIGLPTQAFVMRAIKNEIDRIREVVGNDAYARSSNTPEKDSGETASK